MSEHVLWVNVLGTLADLKRTVKETKKYTKLGFYFTVEELDHSQIALLKEQLRRSYERLSHTKRPIKPRLICEDKHVFNGDAIFHIRVYGPGPLRIKNANAPRISHRDNS